MRLRDPVDGPTANVTYNNGVVVISLSCAERAMPAKLSLDVVSAIQGERAGSFGHPVRSAGDGLT
ncbi:MAG: hypothetical protein IVW36_06480 [Dehalococcoidia bacterium]|nr:hypothetical protein [Dehalococcoidia bacterium]